MCAGPGSHGSTCRTTSRRTRRSMTTTPSGKPTAPPRPCMTSCNVAETSQGIDAGKKIKGRKRHIATDALGLLLVAIVTAASVQDSAGGHQVLDQLADRHPRISKVWVDGGYNNTVIRHGAR